MIVFDYITVVRVAFVVHLHPSQHPPQQLILIINRKGLILKSEQERKAAGLVLVQSINSTGFVTKVLFMTW